MAKRSMLPIEMLEKQLRERFPEARITLDRPKRSTGIWYLDVVRDGHPVAVQWKAGAGFGVSSSMAHAYGEGADEVYAEAEAAYGRIVSLLLSRIFTSAPEPVRLRELRKARGLSQAELAQLLNKQQGEISKIERRSDVLVSTLREVLQSMGATLKISACFPNEERPLAIGEATAMPKPPKSLAAG
jgi:DNA-binding XRE family transcriptional regulator